MGQMGQALLLASTRVEPAVLRERGFAFTDASLDAALERLLRD
jgi:NAD dependent epimerase/dehydratase family enzyme